MCKQLSAPVRGSWKACSLALSPFASAWERIEAIWEDEALGIKDTLAVSCSLATSESDLSEESSFSTCGTLKTNIAVL
jgi:hypothetical protein